MRRTATILAATALLGAFGTLRAQAAGPEGTLKVCQSSTALGRDLVSIEGPTVLLEKLENNCVEEKVRPGEYRVSFQRPFQYEDGTIVHWPCLDYGESIDSVTIRRPGLLRVDTGDRLPISTSVAAGQQTEVTFVPGDRGCKNDRPTR